MTVRTSAKSRLMTPGRVIRSQMPCTPWRSTSSAMRNASIIETPRSSTSSRRSFGHDDERVDAALQRVEPGLGGLRAALALEAERHRHDADGQRAELARGSGDDGRGAGAGAAALAGGHEHEIGSAQHLAQAVDRVLGGLAAEIGVGSRAETARQLAADLQLDARIRHRELLRIGVDGHELDAVDVGVDHALERVEAAAADADDADRGEVGGRLAARAQRRGQRGHALTGIARIGHRAQPRRLGGLRLGRRGLGLGIRLDRLGGTLRRRRRLRRNGLGRGLGRRRDALGGLLGRRLGGELRLRSRAPASPRSGGRGRPAAPRACWLYVCSRSSTSSASDR